MSQINFMGTVHPQQFPAVAGAAAPRQTAGSGHTAKVIRRLIGQPEHSYILQEAPRRYIYSVREAGVTGSYRKGLEASVSRDAVNWQQITSMQTLLGDLRGAGPDENGGFIMAHLDSLLREHSQYLRSEDYAGFSWLSEGKASSAPAAGQPGEPAAGQPGEPAAGAVTEAPERKQVDSAADAAPSAQDPMEPAPGPEPVSARATPAEPAQALPQPQVQGDLAASGALR